jgi:hypothetical protein
MAEIVQSLFGVSPEMYQRQQQDRADAQALQYAKLDPFQQANYAIGRGANMLGGAIGGALGGQDPELQRVTMRQQIAGQLNPNDLSTFDSGIEMLRRGGDGQGALMLQMERDKAQQLLLTRQDQDLARQDAAAKRQREAAALMQQQEAQRIAQGAFVPGVPEQQQFVEVDEQGQPVAIPGRPASFDISRVAPQLMALGAAGQQTLLGASKVNEEMAKAEKLAAEAISAQQKARFAGPAEQAAALKATADAETARVQSLFAERLQQAGLTEKNWNVKNVQSQISNRAAALNLNAQTTAATVADKLSSIAERASTIPADTKKLVNDAVVFASTSKQSANQMNDLANRIENLGGYGSLSRLGEFAKSTIGAEGYETSLRQEYTRIRNSAAIKALPPGPATDADIQLALSGFPKNTADSKLVAQFLRGMAKLQDIDSAVSNAKADWLAQNNGTLTRAGKTFIAGDFTVRPGESFNDFTTRVARDVNAQYAGTGRDAQRQSLINQIPTNASPRPAATQTNIMNQADAILQRGR